MKVDNPRVLALLGLITVIVAFLGGLVLFVWFGRWLKKGAKASEAELISAQLNQLREMKTKGLVSAVEYDAIRRQLMEKIKASEPN